MWSGYNPKEKIYQDYKEELQTEMLRLQKIFLYFIIFIYGSYTIAAFLPECLAEYQIKTSVYVSMAEVVVAILLLLVFKYWLLKHKEYITPFSIFAVMQFLIIGYLQYAYFDLKGDFLLLIFAIIAPAIFIIQFNFFYAAGLILIFACDIFAYCQQFGIEYGMETLYLVCVQDIFVFVVAMFININFTRMKREEIVIKSKLIHERDRDGLTGLLNRRAGEWYIQNHGSEKGLSAMILLDVDNFKQINDTFGHKNGDAVLVSIASIMDSIFRESDYKIRLGGDEFLIFMTDLPSHGIAIKTVEKFIRSVTNTVLVGEKKMEISCSVGIVFQDGSFKNSFTTLYERADTALYESKREGKGKYSVWSGGKVAEGTMEKQIRNI